MIFSCSPKGNEITPSQQTCFIGSINTTDGINFSTTKYSYSLTGLLLQKVDSSNSTISYFSSYTIKQVSYLYDKNDYLKESQTTLSFFSKDGKLVEIPSKRVESYMYNPQGQLIKNEHYGIGQFLSEPALTDTYDYNNGQLTQATLRTSSETVVISFRSGLPITMTSTPTDPTIQNSSIYEINEQGFVKSIRFKDVINRQWLTIRNYDNQQRLISIETKVDNQNPSKYLVEYDDKKSPETLVPTLKGFPQYDLYGKQLNNVIKTSYVENTGNAISTIYEYNNDSYPIKSQITGSTISNPINYLYTYSMCK
ncbi:hypothetical protein SAMN05216167_10264 [Spirosoma endophyticum]|uniref:Uncharacterized protein n=2 Tax=Spirosoma endophyticum TaxID=662367 RepID=A0A1I1L3G9_9BACT|nr:hypothetical protein SAMN05216167_10264 [Spirosoma endophyticum]